MKKINIRGICAKAILHHFSNYLVVMEAISESTVKKIEDELENSKNLTYLLFRCFSFILGSLF